MTTQGGKMNQREAREYLAANPGKEVIDVSGNRYRMTEKGQLEYRQSNGTWRGSVSGLCVAFAPFSPYPEPKPPLESSYVRYVASGGIDSVHGEELLVSDIRAVVRAMKAEGEL